MKFQLNIATPCTERWENFTPTATGGFCGSCQKNVIDFTHMSELALVAYFNNLPPQDGHMCGSFRNDQLQKPYDTSAWFPAFRADTLVPMLDVPIAKLITQKNTFKLPIFRKLRTAAAIGITFLTLSCIESAQGQVSGKIIDSEGLPLAGVSIKIKGTNKGTASNIEGNYTLSANVSDTLEFSFVGFEHLKIAGKDVKSTITMEESAILLGEVIIRSYPTKGRVAGVMGGLSVCTISDINQVKSLEPAPKVATAARILGNPTVSDFVTIAPELDPFIRIKNLEERVETETWIAQNGFEEIESVEVYDNQGKIFNTSYVQLYNGHIRVNLKNVPNGLCFVRVTFSNERSMGILEKSAVRVIVNR